MNNIQLDWSVANIIFTSYEIYRKIDTDTDYTLLATVAGNIFTYTDATIEDGILYDYYVKGIGSKTIDSNIVNTECEEQV